MGRQFQFEVQYTLSLIVGVLGLIGTEALSGYIRLEVGLGFLIMGGFHLILLSIVYSFEKTVSIPIPLVERIEGASVWTLRLATLFFVYLLFHGLSRSLLPTAVSETNRGLIVFGLPLLPVVIIVMAYILSILPFKRFSDDVSITIVPDGLTIFENYEDGRPGHIEVVNDGERTHEFEIVIDLPENVYARYKGEEYADEIRETLSFSGKGLQTMDLQLRHDSSTQKMALTKVNVDYKTSTREIEWETLLA
ncbi:hypothetical protein [Natrarchaeobius chitinivorans]|nr:hypothetical protein [Natrarchaeobius chitinivorans]